MFAIIQQEPRSHLGAVTANVFSSISFSSTEGESFCHWNVICVLARMSFAC